MRKAALVFLLAVAVPSLVLAALALRSLRDQRLVQERQEILLAEAAGADLARAVEAEIDRMLADFSAVTDTLIATNGLEKLTGTFDDEIRRQWPAAAVGFAVNLTGQCFMPSVLGRTEAMRFRIENERFLGNVEAVEVTWNSPKGRINVDEIVRGARSKTDAVFASTPEPTASRPARTFREILGKSSRGTVARFVQDDLQLLVWHRPSSEPAVVFGAQVDLAALRRRLVPLIAAAARPDDAFVAMLRDDSQRPVALTRGGFSAEGQRPLAAADIGDKLPHWHVALFAVNPGHAGAAAATARFTLGLLVAVLLLAIAIGSWLIAADLSRQLRLARQKSGFVSNVSHELKTPLTSIRMFVELLGEDDGRDPARRAKFLGIVRQETERLSRLVDNVLDFGRLERGEVPWKTIPTDLVAVARAATESFSPQLEAAGVVLTSILPDEAILIQGDRDALSQVLHNLLSNVGKYAAAGRSAEVRAERDGREVVLTVSDRGPGLPAGSEERIFEEFFRAQDSLASGVPGCGLGLALARRIVLAHHGTLHARQRPGGGACFITRLPLAQPIP